MFLKLKKDMCNHFLEFEKKNCNNFSDLG